MFGSILLRYATNLRQMDDRLKLKAKAHRAFDQVSL
jgi:hypothetical protein